jgi:hypothetical protein
MFKLNSYNVKLRLLNNSFTKSLAIYFNRLNGKQLSAEERHVFVSGSMIILRERQEEIVVDSDSHNIRGEGNRKLSCFDGSQAVPTRFSCKSTFGNKKKLSL